MEKAGGARRRVFVVRAERGGPDDANDQVEGVEVPLDDPAAMQALSDPLRVRLLRLLDEPASARDLSEAVDRPVTSLYHHLDRLEEAGLIAIAELRKEGRTTVRRYRRTTRVVDDPKRRVRVRMSVELAADDVEALAERVRAVVDEYVEQAKRRGDASGSRFDIVLSATEVAGLGEDDE